MIVIDANGNLKIIGSLRTFASGTIAGNYVVLTTDSYLFANASGGNMTVTLPAPSSVTGQVFAIKKIDNTGFTVTVVGVGGELIDGAASQIISNQYVSLSVISTGSIWYIV